MLVGLLYLVQEQDKSSDIEQQPALATANKEKHIALNKGGYGHKTNENGITQERFAPQYSHLVC